MSQVSGANSTVLCQGPHIKIAVIVSFWQCVRDLIGSDLNLIPLAPETDNLILVSSGHFFILCLII